MRIWSQIEVPSLLLLPTIIVSIKTKIVIVNARNYGHLHCIACLLKIVNSDKEYILY